MPVSATNLSHERSASARPAPAFIQRIFLNTFMSSFVQLHFARLRHLDAVWPRRPAAATPDYASRRFAFASPSSPTI
eukprot:5021412-Prymnesium_polylepis.1